MKEKKKVITSENLGILFSVIGIIASIIVIILNFVNNENKTIGIVSLCTCSVSLSANVNNKKNKK